LFSNKLIFTIGIVSDIGTCFGGKDIWSWYPVALAKYR